MRLRNKIIAIIIFAIAMGFLEAIVVVYLRAIFYPDGFEFPLQLIPDKIYMTEIVREICTIVMLLSLAWIAGKNRLQKFAWFLLSFGIWDIFYYVALKLFLGWPESLLTWDILFLIPITWVGPVLAPVICSIFIIFLSVAILLVQSKNRNFNFQKIDWLLIFSGFFSIFLSFTWNYSKLIVSNDLLIKMFIPNDYNAFKEILLNYIPGRFFWELFIPGIVLIGMDIIITFKKIL